MAPLPPNTTSRVFIDYITGNAATSQEHTLAIRGFGPVTNTDDVQARFLGFVQAIGAGNLPAGWRVLRVRLQQAGSDFSLPVDRTAGVAAFVGTGSALAVWNEPRELTWQGRSFTSGRRVDFSVYGIQAPASDNYRFPSGGGSPTWVAATVNYLNGNPVGIWTTIDGTAPTWYPYVNVNYNSYWETRQRSV